MRLLDRIEDMVCDGIDLLPRFLARPIMYVIAFLYFQWRWLLFVFLPTFAAFALGLFLLDELPPGESIPAMLALAAPVAALWWQWWRAESFCERISTLEDEAEELMYADASGNN